MLQSDSQKGAESFGDLLRRYRNEAGLTQEELAERAGMSVRGISDLERGARRVPYRHTLRRLTEALRLAEPEQTTLEAARSAAPGRRWASADGAERSAGWAVPPLPVPLTNFIGRERDIVDARGLLASARLLTLVGTGGVGKTRLALEVARAPVADVAAFVDLAPVSDGQLAPAAVAAGLGVRERPDVPLLDMLISVVAPRGVLLVLDNCEHLVQACAELADRLLQACPSLRILATSREPLRVAGEQLWQVLPLALPEPGDADATASEAVQLFIERARLVQPDFHLNQQNASVAAQVCRWLDGIPLAIELAAARLPSLGLEQLAARLEDRFHVLTQGSRAAPARHRTLRAIVDWSYELLSDPERTLFRRLAVFAGGWTLEMAEEICAGEGLDRREILDVLVRLAEKSLIVMGEDGAQPRYSFLETLRQYAAERLWEAADSELTPAHHLEWCVVLAERADAEKDGPRRQAWLGRLEREHGNLRTALAWSLADPRRLEAALRLAGALGWFWWLGGHAREGSYWLREVLERPSVETPADPRAGGVAWARAWALAEAGRLFLRQGDLVAARRLLHEGLLVARRAGRREAEACALLYLGELALEEGDSAAARAYLEDGVALAREQPGAGPALCRFLHWLGHAAEADAQPHEATSFYTAAREWARTSGDAFFESIAARGLASAAIERGELGAARAFLLDAVALSRRVENARIDDPALLAHFARLAAAERQPERALCLAAAVAALGKAAGTHLFRYDQQLLERRLESARRLVSAAAAAAATNRGLAMGREEAMAYAVTAAHDRGAPDGAALTSHEREVATLVCRGWTNQQIAAELLISRGTAKRHVENILRKLGLASRAQLLDWAARQAALPGWSQAT
jgi:predicted ATPase/DNA-binding CsgD family transcriptional regulator/transcriptional regulator with XRE-family HTH domain